jgi:hypothetical protein
MQTNEPEMGKHLERHSVHAGPQQHARPAKAKPARGLAAVSDAVRFFLTEEFQAREIRVTRIAALPKPDGGWEAEAEILVPDLAIKTLGLALTQEVLERRRYAVLLDETLAVRGYDPLDHDG